MIIVLLLMKLMIFISPVHLGQVSGSTSQISADFAPFLCIAPHQLRYSLWLIAPYIDNFAVLKDLAFFLLVSLFLLLPVSTHPVAVPTVKSDKLEEWFRNMLRYRCNKFQRRKYLEVHFVYAMCHLRAIDNRSISYFVLKLCQREGVADDVLRQVFHSKAVMNGYFGDALLIFQDLASKPAMESVAIPYQAKIIDLQIHKKISTVILQEEGFREGSH